MKAARRPLTGSGDAGTTPSYQVDVVSGSFGAGHDSAAREIARRLREQGCSVRVHDVVSFFPAGLGRPVRAAYVWQLSHVPTTWGVLLRLLGSGRSRRASTALIGIAARRLRTAVHGSAMVISTHPISSQILGDLRRRGLLSAPAVTYLTDASVHALWVHPDIDLHLAWHAVSASQACDLGGEATVIEPLVPDETVTVHTSRWHRKALVDLLALDPDRPVALVVGGSMGIGELQQAALDVLATGLAQPVVLCGTNAGLHHRIESLAGVGALAWRDDLPQVLAGVDVVIQNAGGFTSLEAMAIGVPVVSYRCLPGHGVGNAAALAESGLVPWAQDPAALTGCLLEALSGGRDRRLATVRAQSLEDVVMPRLSSPSALAVTRSRISGDLGAPA